MLQNFYPASEAFYECEICHEPITNPLCPACLTEEINVWSTNYPNLRKELGPKLKRYLKKLRDEAKESIQCIKCNKAEFSLCPFCFARKILGELEVLKASRIIKKEFLQFFNYNLEPAVF